MKSKGIYWILSIILIVISIGSFFLGSAQSSKNNTDLSQIGTLHHIHILDMPETQVSMQTQLLEPAPLARFRKITEDSVNPDITAESALVLDFATGDIMYQKNSLNRHQLASITKLLTASVVLDEYKWSDNRYISMTQSSFDTYGGNSLQVGEQFRVEDIIMAALMMSSNDAAQLLAENFGGVDSFVVKMNQKAEDLQMTQSKFFNSHGLDQDPVSNYSTAFDVMKLTQDIYDKHPELMEVLRQKEITINSQSGQAIRIGNTNELLGVIPQMIGAKTGLTNEAGETLASVVSIQNRIVGIVVLQSGIGGYRFQDTRNLIKWVEDNYSI